MDIRNDQDYIRHLNIYRLLYGKLSDADALRDSLTEYEMRQGDILRKGNWIPTISGIRFWILDPRPEEVSLFDIAYGLSRLPRFNCMTIGTPYVVGQHCVEGSFIIEEKYQKHFMVHDGPEAYVQDITTPLKKILGKTYYDIESGIEEVIAEKVGIEWTEEAHKRVKEVDNLMLQREISSLTQHMLFPADQSFNPLEHDWITPWHWRDAFHMYRSRMNSLMGYKCVPEISEVISRDNYERQQEV